MNPELLTLRRITSGIVFPPRATQPVEINRIYAAITEHYQYQTLQHLPDGARMASPQGDCFIQHTRIQVNEGVDYFPSSKEKCLHIFGIAQHHLGIQQFVNFGVKLTAFLPMKDAPMAAQFVESRMLRELSEKFDILGAGRQGAGVRIVVHREGIHEIRIEPFFNDLSQLYVELDVQYPTPFMSLETIEPRLDAAYDYLFGEVKDFISSF